MRTLIIIVAVLSGTCGGNSRISHELLPEYNSVPSVEFYPDLRDRINMPEPTPLGNYYTLTVATDSTCLIEWGNRNSPRRTRDDFHFNVARRFRLEWENGRFVVLRSGPGTGSWFSLFLPLDTTKEESILDNTLAWNKERSLVVAEQPPGSDTIMYLLNLETGQRQYIQADEICASFNHYCLDTVALTDREVYYKWSVPHRYADKPQTSSRKVKIMI